MNMDIDLSFEPPDMDRRDPATPARARASRPTTGRDTPIASPTSRRQRRTADPLMMALIYSFAIACATGITLMLSLRNDHLVLLVLVAHLVSGTMTLILLAPCLFVHLRRGKEPFGHLLMPWRLTHRASAREPLHHRVLGYLLMCCILATLSSGAAISAPAITYLSGQPLVLSLGSSALLLRVHLTFAGLAVFFVLLHFPKRAAS
ncbi:MAG: hypothetical protein LBP86_00130 [Azoarcus sp.]|jgi:hypothetical protein|nr:hypothetical protein [Azoarcus sp.]